MLPNELVLALQNVAQVSAQVAQKAAEVARIPAQTKRPATHPSSSHPCGCASSPAINEAAEHIPINSSDTSMEEEEVPYIPSAPGLWGSDEEMDLYDAHDLFDTPQLLPGQGPQAEHVDIELVPQLPRSAAEPAAIFEELAEDTPRVPHRLRGKQKAQAKAGHGSRAELSAMSKKELKVLLRSQPEAASPPALKAMTKRSDSRPAAGRRKR